MTGSTNIIRTLRDLIPRRALTWNEAERLTELQANRLRELLGIEGARLPEEAVSGLPRIEVQRDFEMPVSGLASWGSGKWEIVLNASEPYGRQRFSLLHELKHVIDHTTKQYLYVPGVRSSEEKAERLADYFAACALMPKRHVKRLFGERQSVTELALSFDVTPRAVAVRLNQLGLTGPVRRCNRPLPAVYRPEIYERSLSLHGVAA
jgi:hypothetical protein